MNAERIRAWARGLKTESVALYLAARHPGTPWYAKAIAGFVAAYALSPIDLIPDFVPVLGYLDDLLIIPAGIALCVRLIPEPVMQDCRSRAAAQERPVSRTAAAVILVVWAALAVSLVMTIAEVAGRR